MKKYRIAICDDDVNTASVIKSVVATTFAKSVIPVDIEMYSSVDSLAGRMSSQVYDLLFLDICMPKCDGISFGEKLRKAGDTTDIIFVSSHDDRVFDALKIHPFGFVRKNNFTSEITEQIENYIASLQTREKNTITVRGKGNIVTVKVPEVIYIEGSGKFQVMHVSGKDEPISVYRSMESLEAELDKFGFIRIHKGFLVNYAFISRILVTDVELVNGEALPLSRRKVTDIKTRYLELLKGGGGGIIF